jgi:hypothetical protein
MRGQRQAKTPKLTFVDLEERVPRNHPLRVVKQVRRSSLARAVASLRRDVRHGWPTIDPTGAPGVAHSDLPYTKPADCLRAIGRCRGRASYRRCAANP